ncbi:MAG: universal stress protein E [Alteromonadaceae bacterium]|jgi:universal stress protein E
MKKMLVVIDSTERVKELLKKSLRLLPEKLDVLVFEASVIKEVEAILNDPKYKNCNAELTNASSDSIEDKLDQVIKSASHYESDTIVINRPNIFGQTRDLSFEKKLLKGLKKTSLLICGDKRWKTAMNILGTLDTVNDNVEQRHLNSVVFDVSSQIADRVNGELHFMSVIAISRVSEELDIVEPSEVLAEQGQSVKAKIESFVNSKNSTLKYTSHVTAGVPYKEIPSVAKKEEMDLVILGNVGRTGLKGLIVGNTAEKILQRLSVDVLIVKK